MRHWTKALVLCLLSAATSVFPARAEDSLPPTTPRQARVLRREARLAARAEAQRLAAEAQAESSRSPRLSVSNSRGFGVEVSPPALGPDGQPQAPRLRDLLRQSLLQTFATQPSIRVGKVQVDVKQAAPPATGKAISPAPQLDLGESADPEADLPAAQPEASPTPVTPVTPALSVPATPLTGQASDPLSDLLVARAPADATITSPVPEQVPAPRKAELMHRLRLQQQQVQRAQPQVQVEIRQERLAFPVEAVPVPVMEAEKLKRLGRFEEAGRIQAVQPQLAVPAVRRAEMAQRAVEAPLPKQEALRAVVPDPLQAVPLAPLQAPVPLRAPGAQRGAVPAADANEEERTVAAEFDKLQAELRQLTKDLQALSAQPTIEGTKLKSAIEHIGKTNERLTALRKQLTPGQKQLEQ